MQNLKGKEYVLKNVESASLKIWMTCKINQAAVHYSAAKKTFQMSRGLHLVGKQSVTSQFINDDALYLLFCLDEWQDGKKNTNTYRPSFTDSG